MAHPRLATCISAQVCLTAAILRPPSESPTYLPYHPSPVLYAQIFQTHSWNFYLVPLSAHTPLYGLFPTPAVCTCLHTYSPAVCLAGLMGLRPSPLNSQAHMGAFTAFCVSVCVCVSVCMSVCVYVNTQVSLSECVSSDWVCLST